MKKNILTNINKFTHNQFDDDLIVEIAKINGDEFPYLVYVYGGNSYGQGRNEHGEPHFHFMDKNREIEFKLSIKIPSKIEWNENKNLEIISDDSSQPNWNGLKKEKILLIRWLDNSNNYVPQLTNYEFIILQWNVLNKENNNVRQITD
jgi:hypothetical protein